MWGTGPNDAWVVGSDGLILHYDGNSWSQEVFEGLDSVSLFTVSGRAADDVWVVGGGPRGVLLRRDADGWSEVELPQFTPQVLQGLWTAPGRPVYVGGAYGFTARLDEAGWWQPDAATPNVLHAVGEDPGGGVWAVGGSIMALAPVYAGTILAAEREVPLLDVEPPPLPDAADAADAADVADVADLPETVDVGPEDVGPDDVEEPDTWVQPPCGPADEVCPAPGKPYPESPCVGDLVCDYANGDYSMDHFECEDGAWSWWSECFVPGCVALPPITEWCDEPFAGHLPSEGVSVSLGPAVEGAPFEPFEPGELVPIDWGPQGMPMLAFRLAFTGGDQLTCVTLTVTAALAEVDMAQASWRGPGPPRDR